MEHVVTPREVDVKSEKSRVGSPLLAESKQVTWVQTERATHEAWGRLTTRSPRAAAMAHYLVAHMERTGAVVASYATLSKITGMSIATVRRAIDDLKADRWVEVVQIGGKGGANAFVINSRVAWAMGRDKLHMAAFTARVIADVEEQPQIDDTPLRRIPTLHPGELQLPTGPGEDPPSQPSIPGMEPDLPALTEQEELEAQGQQKLLT
ncbi:helix-turn-helix domain-containing protein [Paraburkholderia aspalathi]|nr:helix-turn-helix domain-containing protein [Paraburkholderia aspalathi]MBK3836101.1 helix-turn-helix domain-containing protein [Paraburkholderia aspalathi]MBK3844379.1 helix-turn-helix domain-containing protein [Paraburkholderia aspalathi]MBK3865870.1 helix-turn-helix domain-containing protein [Paraburkholderia aspalathi]